MKLNSNEKIIIDQFANLFRKKQNIYGKIYVTNQRIHFQPYITDTQNEEESIYYKNIVEIKKHNNLFIIPNALKIITEIKEYKFIIYNRNELIEILKRLKFYYFNEWVIKEGNKQI